MIAHVATIAFPVGIGAWLAVMLRITTRIGGTHD